MLRTPVFQAGDESNWQLLSCQLLSSLLLNVLFDNLSGYVATD
jgi:hypothetical protein